jgi:hypothetical protein
VADRDQFLPDDALVVLLILYQRGHERVDAHFGLLSQVRLLKHV